MVALDRVSKAAVALEDEENPSSVNVAFNSLN